MNIGQAIKFCRTVKSMSQVELSSIVKISTSYLSCIENGKRSPPLHTVRIIAEALGIPCFLLIYMLENIEGIDKDLNEKLILFTFTKLKEEV